MRTHFIGNALLFLVLASVIFTSGCVSSAVTLRLPFDTDNTPLFLVPMGETLNHPAEMVKGGHNGIDFAWGNNTSNKIMASADGKVAYMKFSEETNFKIEIDHGAYTTMYYYLHKSLVIEGQVVKKGEIIGYARSMHWGFSGNAAFTQAGKSLCPVAYLDGDSQAVLAKIPLEDSMKEAGYASACEGDYMVIGT
ncbi:MAG: M23 family metallopeptidase [Candidatus Aenigmatarchaeota archaeon]